MEKSNISNNVSNCPCGSLQPYKNCCGVYHLGKAYPEDPLSLMKSRYSAYALGNADYIMNTTHPLNPRYEKNKQAWEKQILDFSRKTKFLALTILEVPPVRGDGIGIVEFRVHLEQEGQDVSFTERSYFSLLDGKWMYLDGDILS